MRASSNVIFIMPAAEILRILHRLRWRMALAYFLRSTARATLFFFAVLLILTSVAWWRGGFRPNPDDIPFVLTWPFVFGAFAGVLVTLIRFPHPLRVAQALDLAGRTRDRFVTGLRLAKKQNPSDFENTAMREIAEWARAHSLPAMLPIRFPREAAWIAAPVVMLGLLWWDSLANAATRDLKASQEMAAIADTAKQLDQMAKLTDRHANAAQSEALQKIADRLKQSASQIRAEASEGKDAHIAALREIGILEELVKSLRRPSRATTDELKTLSEALAKHDQTREAAGDMASGHFKEAARKMMETDDKSDAGALEEIRETLKQALNHLARRSGDVSSQIQELQQRAEGGQGDVVKQVAEALSALQPSPSGGRAPSGAAGPEAKKPMSESDMKKMLGALENLKNQQQQRGGDGHGDIQDNDGTRPETKPDGDGVVAMLHFATDGPPGNDSGERITRPTGLAGEDGDQHTTKDPFGDKFAAPMKPVRKEQDAVQLGEGESLSVLIPGIAAGDEKSARRYRELHESALSAAEDAVAQEEVPLGARFLIRRYFHAIRPKQ